MTIKEFFQKPYNWFKNLHAPEWLSNLIQAVNDLMVEIAMQTGKAYLEYLKEQVIIAAKDTSLSPEKKFDYVFKKAKEGFFKFAVSLRDSEVNFLIEYFVNMLKNRGAI